MTRGAEIRENLVVVPTFGRNREFLHDCLASLSGYSGAPVMVVVTSANAENIKKVEEECAAFPGLVDAIESLSDDSSELGGLYAAWARTSANEIFLLHDSCEVLNHRLFDIAFEEFRGRSVVMHRNYENVWVSCLGKYRRAVLDTLDMAAFLPGNRLEAMEAEIMFTQAYSRAEPWLSDFPEQLAETDDIVRHHGRDNHVVRNRYLRKWKASWSIDHVFAAAGKDENDPGRRESQARMAAAVLSEYFGEPRG